MGSRQVILTSAQEDASQRHDIGGAVYLLSGTLTGRDTVPDAAFYWSTHDVTAFGQDFQVYLGPPRDISRTMGYEPGAQSVTQEVRVPVRNLPFAHAESSVAAITDDDFRVENTVATLRVAYLKPGQPTSALTDADYTPVLLNGFLGPPDEVTLDGFVLPVYPRGARRNQHLIWPRMPTADTISGGAIDRKSAGTMPPVIVGAPRGWIKPAALNLGVRGFLLSGYSGGDTVIKFNTITDGPEDLAGGNLPTGDTNTDAVGAYGTGTGLAGLLIHHAGPVYPVATASYDPDAQVFTVTLSSGLATDVPRGGFVQQWGAAFNPTNTGAPSSPLAAALTESPNGNANGLSSWWWVLGNRIVSPQSPSSAEVAAEFGWLFADGEVRPAEASTWDFNVADGSPSELPLALEGGEGIGGEQDNSRTNAQVLTLTRGTRLSGIVAPVYYDPVNGTTEVTQQPEFTSTQTASLLNYPTGGTGANNANARDGNDVTVMSLATSEVKTLTFNSAPSPFADSDTVASTLHVIGTGTISFTDSTGSVSYGSISSTGTFRFTLVAPADFNATVRCVGGGSGGNVAELWWEHNLSAAIQSTRTTDVKITSASAPLGPPMEYAELVVKLETPSTLHSLAPSGGGVGAQRSFPDISGALVTLETRSPSTMDPYEYQVPYPTNVMMGLHALLNFNEGAVDLIDLAAYAAAHERYVADNLRLGFVWTDANRPKSWTELEQRVALNSRSQIHYGPSGHQMVYMEAASGFEALPVLQSFRLPGVPGANCIGAQAPLLERTRTTELINQAEAGWAPDYLANELTRVVSAENAESVADVGIRRRDRGRHELDMHTPWEGNTNYAVAAGVSGIVQFYADRQAFTATRFNFETAWVAHGLDRGSIIRVTYPVSTTPPSYRNVTAEVESLSASPINAERTRVRARSVSKPQKGLEPAFTWLDVFIASSDAWSTRILQEFDTWEDYWSVK